MCGTGVGLVAVITTVLTAVGGTEVHMDKNEVFGAFLQRSLESDYAGDSMAMVVEKNYVRISFWEKELRYDIKIYLNGTWESNIHEGIM